MTAYEEFTTTINTRIKVAVMGGNIEFDYPKGADIEDVMEGILRLMRMKHGTDKALEIIREFLLNDRE